MGSYHRFVFILYRIHFGVILYVWVKKDFWDIFVHTLGITQGVVSGVYDLVFVFSEGLRHCPGCLFSGFPNIHFWARGTGQKMPGGNFHRFQGILAHTLGFTQGVVSVVYDLFFVSERFKALSSVLFLGFSKFSFLGPGDRVENVRQKFHTKKKFFLLFFRIESF